MQARKILLATDFSEASRAALELAAEVARGSGAILLIAHVSELELHPVGELFNEEPRPDPSELARLKSVVPAGTGLRYEHRLLHGEPGSVETTNPADIILKAAEREQADLIVLGTHARSGVGHVLMGSVAESVLRRAACAVVVVKPPRGG